MSSREIHVQSYLKKWFIYLNVAPNVFQVNSEVTRTMSIEETQNNFIMERTPSQYSVRIQENTEQDKLRLTRLMGLVWSSPWKY